MSAPILDLALRHWVKERGDLIIYATWVGQNLDESEPCLVIMPKHYNGSKPCCVALSVAYRYYEPEAGHRYLLARARQFNEQMGRADTLSNVHAVADAIYDHLQELIEIPPKPITGRRDMGTVTMHNRDTGQSRTIEVHEDV